MSGTVESARPNIRIQISNSTEGTAEEKMEVDQDQNGNEEGEITEDETMSKDGEEMAADANFGPNETVSIIAKRDHLFVI